MEAAAIAKEFDEEGYKMPKGGKWAPTQIKRVLERAK
jgi:hypothetical protein